VKKVYVPVFADEITDVVESLVVEDDFIGEIGEVVIENQLV